MSSSASLDVTAAAMIDKSLEETLEVEVEVVEKVFENQRFYPEFGFIFNLLPADR
jgi:hypothetical protein